MWLRKMLMTAADSSPGGGAAPPNGASQANGTGAAGSPDPIAQVREEMKAMLGEFRNGVFADLRRAGALGDDDKPKARKGAANSEAPPAPTSDPMLYAKLQRHIGAAGFAPEQEEIVETLFAVEKPDAASLAGWVAAKAKAFGVTRAGTSTVNASAPPAAAPPSQPASGAGAPPASPKSTDDTPLHLQSKEDQAAFVKRHGIHAYRVRLQRDLKGVQVQVRRR